MWGPKRLWQFCLFPSGILGRGGMLWYLIVPSSRAVQQGYWTIQCTICCLCSNIALYPKTEIQKALSDGENFLRLFSCVLLGWKHHYAVQLGYWTIQSSAQCAAWGVRWSCSILASAVKTLSYGKTIFFRLFFLCSFRKKNWKLVSLFIFQH